MSFTGRVFVRSARPLSGVVLAALALPASAQCTPTWDAAPGTPGIPNGYVAPMFSWSDGAGTHLYAGGSFTRIGGVAGTGYAARRDPGTGAWSKLGTGIGAGSTNAFVTSFQPFDPGDGAGERLVVGGFWSRAGGLEGTPSIAMWNGEAWESMNTGWDDLSRGSVWGMTTWKGKLIVGGGFSEVGGAAAGGIAEWDGKAWAGIGSGIVGSFSPFVAAVAVFNDGSNESLYIAGRFDSVEGIPGTGSIARWAGSAWESVGGGLITTSTFFGLECFAAFDDGTGPALYVGGYEHRKGSTRASVWKWDGASWTPVGQRLSGRITSLASFDDGNGPKLYMGGTANFEVNYFARLEGDAWVPVGGGVTGDSISGSFPSVFGIDVWEHALYIGGDFTKVGDATANGLAAYIACDAACRPDCTKDGKLNVNDFICFQSEWRKKSAYGDYNGDGVWNVNDFIAFQAEFRKGCG